MRAAHHEEFVDRVDEHDRVIEVVTRSRMRRENLLHRGVSIVVQDPDGRVLVHRRADTKDVWPGLWDLAAGGVVSSGEEYSTAAHRELAEELGVEDTALEFLGQGSFEDDAVRVIAALYRTVHAGPVSFPDGEVAEARWVTIPELRQLLREQRFVPDSVQWCRAALPTLFAAEGPAAYS